MIMSDEKLSDIPKGEVVIMNVIEEPVNEVIDKLKRNDFKPPEKDKTIRRRDKNNELKPIVRKPMPTVPVDLTINNKYFKYNLDNHLEKVLEKKAMTRNSFIWFFLRIRNAIVEYSGDAGRNYMFTKLYFETKENGY